MLVAFNATMASGCSLSLHELSCCLYSIYNTLALGNVCVPGVSYMCPEASYLNLNPLHNTIPNHMKHTHFITYLFNNIDQN